MVSVYPGPDEWGPHERPNPVAQTPGLPRSYVELTRVVPFNDAESVKRVFEEFPDQIAGMRQLAERYPFIDLERVGIWGHSGGGFATTSAMFRYPDFFKVGIAESGNHDQRNYEDDWGERYQGLLVRKPDGTDTYDVEANQTFASNLKVGNGLEAGTTMGPLANPRRITAMETIVADAQANGAKVQTGGKRIGNQGYFYQPTVLTDVPDDAKIMNEEPFGPIAVIQRFKEFDDVIKRANRLPYGLASYAFTKSAKTATAVADQLDAGMVTINHFGLALPETPFGGIKDSGIGSEGGLETFDGYLVTKFITHI